jgi:hypothetical protein
LTSFPLPPSPLSTPNTHRWSKAPKVKASPSSPAASTTLRW